MFSIKYYVAPLYLNVDLPRIAITATLLFMQTNRILTYKPPDFRVVIAETVVVQPAFFVVILTLEAERDVDFEAV